MLAAQIIRHNVRGLSDDGERMKMFDKLMAIGVHGDSLTAAVDKADMVAAIGIREVIFACGMRRSRLMR